MTPPLRTCCGCHRIKAAAELQRITLQPSGVLQLDGRHKAAGRGAYLCPNAQCLQSALRHKALQRAFGVDLPHPVLEEFSRRFLERSGETHVSE